MGYACPVCEVPQRDAEHLANHLAFTAMLHGDDHEAWLDEHVPGWGDHGPEDLGEAVAPLAEEAEYDEVFDDTVARQTGGRNLSGDHDHGVDRSQAARPAGAGLDEEAAAVVRRVREMAREMRDDGREEKR